MRSDPFSTQEPGRRRSSRNACSTQASKQLSKYSASKPLLATAPGACGGGAARRNPLGRNGLQLIQGVLLLQGGGNRRHREENRRCRCRCRCGGESRAGQARRHPHTYEAAPHVPRRLQYVVISRAPISHPCCRPLPLHPAASREQRTRRCGSADHAEIGPNF